MIQNMQIQFMEFLFADKPANEYIAVFGIDKINSAKTTVRHFLRAEEAIKYSHRIKKNFNVFVGLATTDGGARAAINNGSRNVIAFDFDKKDLGKDFNHKDIINLFKKVGLYYHMCVASGGGYHIYLKIDRTTDLDKQIEVNKHIASLIGADPGAVLPTQVLRMPGTYNYKRGTPELVKLVWIAPKIANYSVDELHHKFISKKSKDFKNIYQVTNQKNNYFCIDNVLQYGAEEGDRNYQLNRLISFFKIKNYSHAKITAIITEWNQKCSPPLDDSTLQYQLEYAIKNDYKYFGCRSSDPIIQQKICQHCDQSQCNKGDKSELVCHELKTIKYEYGIMERVKYKSKRLSLTGNHLAIIGILKNNFQGLTDKQLESELTSIITGKKRISHKTRLKVYDELVELKLLNIKKGTGTVPHLYKLIDAKCLENEKIFISHNALMRFVDGAINQSAFRLYCYMIYRMFRKENIVEAEVAEDLNLTQATISEQINELEKARFIYSYLDRSICRYGAKRYEWCI